MRKIHFKDAEGKVVKMNNNWMGKIGRVQDVQIVNNNITGRLIEIPSTINTWVKLRPEDDGMVTLLSKLAEERLYKNLDYKKILENAYLIGGVSLGADPEIFVVNKEGTIIPAFTFLPSKKEGNPFWDGFQAEFTTQAHHCLAFLVDEIQRHLSSILYKAQKFDETAQLTYKSVVDIPYNMMEKADKQYVILGCAPSNNIYNIPSIKIDDPYALPIRFAGCHLHLGSALIKKDIKAVINSMDTLIGIISITLFQKMEDERRRRYYGRAGEFRTPVYGIEYRTLSSAMLSHPALFHLCYDLARASTYIPQLNIPHLWNTKGFSIPDIINDYDVITAKKVITQNKSVLKAILHRLYKLEDKNITKLYNLMIEGAINLLPVDDIANNWHIKQNQRWTTHSEGTNCCVYKLNI